MGKGKRLREQRSRNTVAVKNKPLGITKEWYYILRYIAIITMFSDHLGKVLGATGLINADVYFAFTAIGRIAFPLFAYMLVESFFFTKNKKKHLLQIGILFLLSELPFDMTLILKEPLAFDKTALNGQNTCLTLFLGFLMLIIMNADWKNLFKKLYKREKLCRVLEIFTRIIIAGIFAFIATALMTDYAWRGIMLIAFFYSARNKKAKSVICFFAMTLFTFSAGAYISKYMYAYFALIPIFLVQSEIGKIKISDKFEKMIAGRFSRTFCRFFYPAHLLLLAIFKMSLI